ncbi:MAG TPA: hypothetical protein VF862_10605 [Gemmatimonadales bacterium]
MTMSRALSIVVILCALWAVAMIVLLTRDLKRRGYDTPWPLMGWRFFRNASLYREVTLKEDGRVGPLFKAFVIPINLAWILALVALAIR